MKKIHLLLSTPLLVAAPVVACLTSCGSSSTSIKITIDGSDIVVTSTLQELKKDEMGVIQLSIADSAPDSFLPTEIDSIVCGGATLEPLDLLDIKDNYFVYSVDEGNKTGKLIIKKVLGDITIAPKLTVVSSISAFWDEILTEEKVFFDKGQTISQDDLTIMVAFEDGGYYFSKDYDLTCQEEPKWVIGHKFDETDINKEHNASLTAKIGTKTFQSQSFKIKCIEKTVVKFNGDRYTSITDAIDAYNQIDAPTLPTTYYLQIVSGDYVLTDPLVIEQTKANKNLVISPETTEGEYAAVSLQGTISTEGTSESRREDSLIKIVGPTDAASLIGSSVKIKSLTFASPDHSGLSSVAYNDFYDICLDTNDGANLLPSNIKVQDCAFYGDIDTVPNRALVTAIKSKESSEASGGRYIDLEWCLGYNLNSFFDGYVNRRSELLEDAHELYISTFAGYNCYSLANIKGNDLNVKLSTITGDYLAPVSDTGTTSGVDSVISFDGYGILKIENSVFKQLAYGTGDKPAFIKLMGTSETANDRKLIIKNTLFGKYSQEAENKIKHLYNASDQIWNYSYDSVPDTVAVSEQKDIYSE